jgi:hypothetical protein
MKNSVPDRSLIREYLLGRLDDNQELENGLSEKILLDDELSETVDTVEDEIIDEYLDGALNSSDRNAVDAYFLRPPERKEKLRFAQLLRGYSESERSDLFRPDEPPVLADPGKANARQTAYSSFHLAGYGLAALILIGFVMQIYLSHSKQGLLESKLAEVQKENARLEQETQLSQASMALTLLSPRTRGARITEIPQVDIQPLATHIRVEIAVPNSQAESCDVHLETIGGKGPIWSARLLPNVLPSGGARLVFDVPTRGIESGAYSFVVSSGGSSAIHYDFKAQVAQ